MSLMRSASHYKKNLILPMCIFSIVPIYIGLLIAPYTDYGIAYFINHQIDFTVIRWCGFKSIKVALICLFIYAIAVFAYYNSIKNTRRGEENGSMHWGDPYKLTRKYADRSKKIIPKEEAIRTHQMIISKREILKDKDSLNDVSSKRIPLMEYALYLILLLFIPLLFWYAAFVFNLNTLLMIISGIITSFVGISIRIIYVFKKGEKND